MKRLALAASAVALMSGCASENWTRADTTAEITWQVLNVIDGAQTARFDRTYNLKEANPLSREIIGSRPSASEAWQLTAAYAVSHFLIARALPPKWRRWWHTGSITTKAYTVYSNDQLEHRYWDELPEDPPRLMSVITVGDQQ